MPTRSGTAGGRVGFSSPRIAAMIGFSNMLDAPISAGDQGAVFDPRIYAAPSMRSAEASSVVEAQPLQPLLRTAGKAPRRAEFDAVDHFDVLQSWEGVVVATTDAMLTARLRDIKGDLPEVEADIFLSDVSPDDRALVRQGALLFWVIGYRTTLAGERERVSRIRMRRLPGRSAADVERAAKRAEAERKQFGWN